MAGFESISNILGKFSPAQRLIALVLLLLTILGISLFQFMTSSKPECETVHKQLVETQNQLTSTIASQNTFVQTINDLREQTFDLNTQIGRRDSIIAALGSKFNLIKRQDQMLASNELFNTEPLPMVIMSEPEPVMMLTKKSNSQNEELLQENHVASYPAPILDTIGERSESIDTLSTNSNRTDTVITKGKVSWVRRLLGHKN
jgi:hypothetical protein